MNTSKIEMYLNVNRKHFPQESIYLIKERLEKMDEDKFVMLQSIRYKDNSTALLLGILLSADRIYLDEIGLGIIKLILSFFLIGLIWWLIDLFTITSRVKKYNLKLFLARCGH